MDRMGRAMQGARICVAHWTMEGDTELLADARARLERLEQAARGEVPERWAACPEAQSADVDGALDWLDVGRDPHTDSVADVVARIAGTMPGLARHDLDAIANGWDSYEYPEEGYVWREAVRILSEAAGVEDIFDADDIDDAWVDLWDSLFDAVSSLLED